MIATRRTTAQPMVAAFPLQTINPYTTMLYDAMRQRGVGVTGWSPWRVLADDIDVLHIHWIEQIACDRLTRRSTALTRLGFARLEAAIARVQRRGGRAVWTAHNLRPHESSDDPRGRAIRAGIDRIVRRVDAVIAMSHASAATVREAWPGLPAAIHVVPHPSYCGVYPPGCGARGRAAFGIAGDALVIGMIGMIRPYKAADRAIAMVRSLDRDDIVLLVAGQCDDPAHLARLRMLAGGDPRIVLAPRALDPGGFADAVAASDMILAAQTGVLNSGSVLAALSLGTPVLANPCAALAEIAAAVGPGWLTTGPTMDAGWVLAMLDRSRPDRGPDLAAFALDPIVERHLRVFGWPVSGSDAVRPRQWGQVDAA